MERASNQGLDFSKYAKGVEAFGATAIETEYAKEFLSHGPPYLFFVECGGTTDPRPWGPVIADFTEVRICRFATKLLRPSASLGEAHLVVDAEAAVVPGEHLPGERRRDHFPWQLTHCHSGLARGLRGREITARSAFTRRGTPWTSRRSRATGRG
jgi:hypothetical protein